MLNIHQKQSRLTALNTEEEEDFTYTLRSIAWELIPLFGPLSRRGLNPIKPVYGQMAGSV